MDDDEDIDGESMDTFLRNVTRGNQTRSCQTKFKAEWTRGSHVRKTSEKGVN